ncbi:ABC transporter ATP-binding protein [Guptibacillus hwajinpoensis]|uniref:Branched-chain amino acid transport system ATP-binding protein n=2 Tax=Guptibacillus hwajinpoensis TaxID=208199 RepID=A0ABU0K1R0_9BACL|nr:MULTISPECIES: ABC transporter ATP-binding protein [Alkalihalobacillus]KMM38260.1 leucine/isoleucine/valine transporter ATP-binding subunit [Alkalihalobacillus macyae]MDQ0483289.1 branched-chain amino acid transport system ATP-binding protein [Alkalihalobacillus hemicentroti]
MFFRTEGITKRFGGLAAVEDVSASFEKGSITAIIGPNGAGKSTFFNLISGIHPITSGKVFFKDNDITKMPPQQIARLGIGRTFQTTNLFEQSTVLDNVLIGHRLRTKSGIWDAIFRTAREKEEEKRSYEKAMQALAFVELENVVEHPVSLISQEEKKRLAFALALATDPEMVLLDEPAAGVNPDETDGLAYLMRKMADHGITVCLIEHKMPMIMSLADKIVVLNHGKKIAEGRPDEIRQNEAVIQAYLGGEVHAPVKQY